MRRNTPRLSLSESNPREGIPIPAEYWTRINKQSPLPNKLLLVMDETYGPLIAKFTRGGEWKGCMCPDPVSVTHYAEFEYPR